LAEQHRRERRLGVHAAIGEQPRFLELGGVEAHRGAVYCVARSGFAVGLMRRDGQPSLRTQTADVSAATAADEVPETRSLDIAR
jgi:hypothetical protein